MPNDLVTQLRTAKSMLGENLIGQEDYERVKRTVLESLVGPSKSGASAKTIAHNANGKAKKRVAILGGSFNPITDGHLKMAAEVIHARAADEVWITPCGSRPDKPSLTTSALDRFLMCHLAVNTTFSSDFPVKVSGIELGRPTAVPTVELLPELDRRYPEYEICFVVGSDLLAGIPDWHGGDPEKDHQWYWKREFIVISRPGYTIPHEWVQRGTVKILKPVAKEGKIISSNLSSSEIRRRVTSMTGSLETVLGQTARKVEGLLPLAVNQHISKYNLLGDIVGKNDGTAKQMSEELPEAYESKQNSTNASVKVMQNKSSRNRSTSMDGKIRVGTRALNITIHRDNDTDTAKRVGIFGGIFNPITDGHCKMAAECLHSNAVDEVWIVPCGPRMDIPDLKTSPIDRYIMCHLATHNNFSSNFPIKVIPMEIFEKEAYSTPSLLRVLHTRYPEVKFSFIGGSDLLNDIQSWATEGDDKQWYKHENFLIIERPEYPIDEIWKNEPNITMIESPLPGGNIILSNNSSTEVRRRLAIGSSFEGLLPRSLEGLVPAHVLNHIRRYKLYTPHARDLKAEIGAVCKEVRGQAHRHVVWSPMHPPLSHKSSDGKDIRPLSPLAV
eukprot:g14989.t1